MNPVLVRFGLQDDDDARSVGLMAIVKAARGFKPERGGRFSTYATAAIRYEVGHHTRHTRRRKACQWSENAPDPPDDRHPAAQVADSETASRLWSAVAKLPRRERRLILSVYRDGLSINEAGRRIGLNGTTTKVHAEALAALAGFLQPPT